MFGARFSRYRPLLRFVATRVLGGLAHADEAVGNCRRSASRNPPRFKYDGAFCSWVVRILIDEALAIRGRGLGYEYSGRYPNKPSRRLTAGRVSWRNNP
jgi:DNA-directed RNA polymerase specialized sigma24 family protein